MEIEKCTTLEEARQKIDEVDEEIIKEEERINDVISRARQQAIDLGLSPNLINDLYVRMIDAMVESEIAEFNNAKSF